MNPNTSQSSNENGRFHRQRRSTEAVDMALLSNNLTPWDLYNDKATALDRDMLKQWDNELSTLLIFAALFSAILTAFLIAILPELEEDKLESIQSILVTISNQMRNTSTPAYEAEAFTIDPWVIRVNCLFYASLGSSLFAALASVLALQWIREYDRGFSDILFPRSKALRRHSRLEGIQSWHMIEIISCLPLFLHLAFLLFLGGLVEWIRHLNLTIAGILIAFLGLSGLFYLVTHIIAVVKPTAPFRTPLSRLFTRVGSIMLAKFHPTISKYRTHMWEAELVEENKRLSVSSLVWLLGQIERLERSMKTVLEIFRCIISEDTGLILAQRHSKDEVQWAVMFEAITRSLFPTKRDWEDHGYTIEEETDLMTLFQMIAVVNDGITLKGEVWALLTGFPFDQESEQSTPLGLAVRFAGWRHKRPFPRDSTLSWPKELFSDICKHHRNKLHYIIQVLLQEFGILMNEETEKDNIQEFIITCLTMLWETLDLEDGRPLAKEIRSTMLSTTLSVMGSPVTASTSPHDRVTMVINTFDGQQGAQEYHPFIQALVLQILLDLCSFDCDSRIALFQILRHSSLANLWKSDLKIKSFTIPSSRMHFWPYIKRWYPTSHTPGHPWAVELAAAVKNTIDHLPRVVIKGSDEWRVLTTALETLSVCTGANIFNEISNVAPSDLSQDRCFEWLLDVLSNLSSGMHDERFGFIVSSMLTGSVRNLLRDAFYCSDSAVSQGIDNLPVTRRGRLEARCNDPSLVFAGCALFGWNYEPSRPRAAEHAWNTRALKGAFAHWDNYEPHMFLECDKKLLAELGNREEDNEFWDDYVIRFLQRRAHPIKRLFVETKPSTQDSRPFMEVKANEVAKEIFDTSMVTFGNMVSRDSGKDSTNKRLRLHVGILKVVTQLSALDGFGQNFLKPNNLKWFNKLQWDPLEGDRAIKELGFGSYTPIGALNYWLHVIMDIDDSKALQGHQVKAIINSDVLQTSQERGAPDVIKFITLVSNLTQNVRRSLRRAERDRPTPIEICAKILGEIEHAQEGKLRSNSAYWETEGKALFGVPSFEKWRDGLTLLIDKLNQ